MKIVFIGGSGRNGSTLLGRLLGSLPRTVCIGEAPIFLLDPRRPRSEHPCSCGRILPQCPFWSGLAASITDEDRRTAGRVLRFRYLRHWIRGDDSPVFRRCCRTLERIYRYSVETARDRRMHHRHPEAAEPIIIDTTKHPAYAFAAARLSSVDLRFIHLIRDPRGVVESWARPKAYIAAYSKRRTTLWWIAFHRGAELLSRRVPTLTVRYEDFVRAPRDTLRTILDFMDEPPDAVEALFRGDTWMLEQGHLLGGNPDKFTAGAVHIRRPPAITAAHPFVTLATLPWLIRYRYPLFNNNRP